MTLMRLDHRALSAALIALLALLALMASGCLLSGCDNLANQPLRRPFEVDRSEPGTLVTWEAPPGTVARDEPLQPPPPPPVTLALLQRGRERFDIYCAVCHGQTGYGDGPVVQRGFPAPPSYHTDRLRQAPNEHFYEVISHGYGAMFSYAQRVAPPDRWAIAAYIRALQASQNVPAGQLSPSERAALK